MKRKELLLIPACLLVIVLSVSLAYFKARIEGESKGISVISKNLRIKFNSDSNIASTSISPGWSNTSTFNVTNESDGTYKYNIVIEDLINTFVKEGYLQYKITSTNNGYNMTDYIDIPKSSTPTDTILAYSVSIDKDVTQEYTIEFSM